jgi:methylthioribose-1-phosphate isomerase
MSAGLESCQAPHPTLRWVGGVDGNLVLLDQTRLPREVVEIECRKVDDVWHAIKRLAVRGAPAIGVAAAYGVCLGIQEAIGKKPAYMRTRVNLSCDFLETSRPTAVNLSWAVTRMQERAEQLGYPASLGPRRSFAPFDEDTAMDTREVARTLLAEAQDIHFEDIQLCDSIARHGADLLANLTAGSGILTHCNTGPLCASGVGTALGVAFELHRRGKKPHVWIDETRPLLQGARLTAWECMQRNVDCTLICDSMAAQVMREGRVAAVIVGADRVAADGAVANKIGTYSVAVVAAAHNIPLYVAAPASSFDLSLSGGELIPIEQRAAEEVTHFSSSHVAPDGVAVYNPAFDVTPPRLIRGLITDRGMIQPVEREVIARVLSS